MSDHNVQESYLQEAYITPQAPISVNEVIRQHPLPIPVDTNGKNVPTGFGKKVKAGLKIFIKALLRIGLYIPQKIVDHQSPPVHPSNRLQYLFRRVIHVLYDFIGHIISLGIMLLMPLIILLDTKGPILFKRIRSGQNRHDGERRMVNLYVPVERRNGNGQKQDLHGQPVKLYRIRNLRSDTGNKTDNATLDTAALLAIDHANPGHMPEWCNAIHSAYGHRPVYITVDRGLLPAFQIKSRIGRNVVTSMPFLDAGGPLSSSVKTDALLIDKLTKHAAALDADRIELRCTRPVDGLAAPSLDKVTMILDLPDDPDVLWKDLNAKVRNQVRKAQKAGLWSVQGGSEFINDFYNIFSTNMRDLGSPVHSRDFFQALFQAFGNKARITMIGKDDIFIGGAVSIAFRDRITVPWASCLRPYFHFCPNMLLYWEILKNASESSFNQFDFGRSTPNTGTYRFKKQWGALEQQLYWYEIPVGATPLRSNYNYEVRNVASAIWRHLPLPVTKILGPRLRQYITL